jgi:hypothetical protein
MPKRFDDNGFPVVKIFHDEFVAYLKATMEKDKWYDFSCRIKLSENDDYDYYLAEQHLTLSANAENGCRGENQKR